MKSYLTSKFASWLVVLLGLFLTGLLLSACSLDRWSSVEPGEYQPLAVDGVAPQFGEELVQKIYVDREANQVTFYLATGEQALVNFHARERAAWPSGCPANFNSTRMEVLELQVGEISVGDDPISNPILVRNCPPEPEIIVLRADGEIGGGGSACQAHDECTSFGRPGYTSIPDPDPDAYQACLDQGGRWEDLGISGPGCNLPTADGGNACSDPSECESACLASEESQVMFEDESGYLVPDSQRIDELNALDVEQVGVCSAWRENFGCRVWVIEGRYVEMCVD